MRGLRALRPERAINDYATSATADAHGLYAQFGFTAPRRPQTLMERHDPDIHTRGS